jgi:hypothetical protein
VVERVAELREVAAGASTVCARVCVEKLIAKNERDAARRMLAECTILSGADTDGNTLESGWEHLWSSAVEDVRHLREDYDEVCADMTVEKARDAALARVRELEAEVAALRGPVPKPEAAPWRWVRSAEGVYDLATPDGRVYAVIEVEGDGFRPYPNGTRGTYADDLPAALAILRAKLGAGVPDLDVAALRGSPS